MSSVVCQLFPQKYDFLISRNNGCLLFVAQFLGNIVQRCPNLILPLDQYSWLIIQKLSTLTLHFKHTLFFVFGSFRYDSNKITIQVEYRSLTYYYKLLIIHPFISVKIAPLFLIRFDKAIIYFCITLKISSSRLRNFTKSQKLNIHSSFSIFCLRDT